MAISLRRFVACSAAALALALGSEVAAQVVIDMPAPPKRSSQPVVLAPADSGAVATITTSGAPTVASPAIGLYPVSVRMPDVGEVALSRFANARIGTRDTYSNDGTWWNNGWWNGSGGIRFITYPTFVWGPWWNGWGGWGGWGWVGGGGSCARPCR